MSRTLIDPSLPNEIHEDDIHSDVLDEDAVKRRVTEEVRKVIESNKVEYVKPAKCSHSIANQVSTFSHSDGSKRR